jgi:putative ABC transport system permease protein
LHDLNAIAGMSRVVNAVPVRRFPHESRRLNRVHNSTVVGATPELADLLPLPLEAGRFLSVQDMEERRNVAVLGAAVADALLPDTEALGQNIVLNGDIYVVIGVLDDTTSAEHQASIYLPLTTCQSRFGEKIILRNAGKRRAEAVQLSDIYVTPRSPQDVAPTLEAIRELLTERHEQKDWAVRVGN